MTQRTLPPPITSTDDLALLCKRLAKAEHIAIDTEFLRETTYYPRLCLVQLASNEEAAAVDPLAEGISLEPLFALLADPKVTKIFHAGRQDIEIFFNLHGMIPAPLYDTQVAAMVCGYGDQVSYDRLVEGVLGVKLDKGSRFTNWSARPLTDKQLRYALDDVIYLEQLYPKLLQSIADNKREDWLEEEMQHCSNREIYQQDPDKAWQRIRQRGSRPEILNRLRHLAAWREQQARQRDIPKSRLIKDDLLLAIANANPKSAAELGNIRGFPGGSGGKLVSPLVTVLKQAAQTPKADWPKPPASRKRKPPAAQLDLIRVLLKHVAETAGVAPKLIASADDLEGLACGERDGIMAASGWRYELFGKLVDQLGNGQIAITCHGHKLKILQLKDDESRPE